MKVDWTKLAETSYANELDFIAKKWTSREVGNFISITEEFIKNLELGILTGQKIDNSNLYSFVISKQTTLYFDCFKERNVIELLLFWNNSQDPKKLKKILSNLNIS